MAHAGGGACAALEGVDGVMRLSLRRVLGLHYHPSWEGFDGRGVDGEETRGD
jgi:hypothetical protein